MLNSEIFEIVFWMIIIFVALITILLLATASMQEAKEYFKKRNYQKKKRSRRNIKRKKKEQEINMAPVHLRTLMQPDYIVHFESFVLLLNEIDWPEHPKSSFNEDGSEKSPSIE